MALATKKFLDLLTQNGVITKEQAAKFELDSLQKNIPIDEYLLNSTNLKSEDILKAKGKLLNIPVVNVAKIPVSPQALELIPESLARKHHFIPYEYHEKDNAIKVVMKNPFDLQTIEFLQKKTGKRILPVLGIADDIEKAIDIFYSQGLSPNITSALKDVEPEVKTVTSQNILNLIKEAPIAKVLETILEYSVKGRASDIHIEPQEAKTRVRYRIDGMLQEKLVLPKAIHDSLVSRIKIVSGLKIDEKRIPQDGRFNYKYADEEVDLRVSTLPTSHGEKVVMRLLKKTGGIPDLPELGLRGPQLKLLEEAFIKPYGVLLITGPTGSGKSTTLYSVLSRLNKPTVNIVTLEDPIEYELKGINQVQINPQAGLTFATGLRSFLRQDPNIILVGEIRDKETTGLAIQAALTGHLVLSTLHTNDAATAIPRLIDLGGEPFLIASILNVLVAQRIVRRLCNHCKQPFNPSPEVIEDIKHVLGDLLPADKRSNGQFPKLYRSPGCSECNSSGYFGRVGIFEVLQISPTINRMIIKRSSAKDIEAQARQEGLIDMAQDGYLKAISGITSIEEVMRVSQV